MNGKWRKGSLTREISPTRIPRHSNSFIMRRPKDTKLGKTVKLNPHFGIKTVENQPDVDVVEDQPSLIEFDEIQDRAIIGKITKVVRIRDPVDNRLIVSVRNPGIPIKTYTDREKSKLDLNKQITDGVRNPDIN